MKITVIGSGYVGTTTAAILANSSHQVTVIDIDESKVEIINSGKSPFFETGISELIQAAVNISSLRATTSYEDGIKGAEVVFSCVGTPDKPDGSSNLEYIFATAKSAAKYMDDGVIFVQKSTVPVGTGKNVIDHIAKYSNKNIRYVSSPEFLREGSAVSDTLLFDRVVAGGSEPTAVEKILEIYLSIESNKQMIDDIAKIGIPASALTPNKGQYIATSLESAELIKLTANAFLALKISFANSIAKLADKTDADIAEVMDAVGSDRRIGRAFLYAGRGYGGGCFPKDVSGLIMSAKEYDVDLEIMDSVAKVNATMPKYVVDKLKESEGKLSGKKITVLGLSFKENTSDSRRSPAVQIANLLAQEGAEVVAYDPQANGDAKRDLDESINVNDSVEEAVIDADILVVATAWDEFKDMNLATIAERMKGNVFVDAMNAFDKKDVVGAGFKYIGVGR